MTSEGRRVAVVGAGLAGLACARTLADRGLSVTVFDKGRSPGGRATSRREEGERVEGGRVFDHGAQFFTARGEWLSSRLAAWEEEGVVARWSPRVAAVAAAASGASAASAVSPSEARWVGVPRMGSLAARLARGLDVRLGSPVSAVARSGEVWMVSHGVAEAAAVHQADALVVAVPAAQCAALLEPVSAVSALAREAAAVVQTPCWAVMVSLRGGAPLAADVLEDRAGAVAWAAREGSKPGRVVPSGEDMWTLHASTAWSEAHLEDSPESVRDALTSAFVQRHVRGAVTVVHAKAHRWRFARGSASSSPCGALFDASLALAVCGDWLESARVEGALESGVAAASRILGE